MKRKLIIAYGNPDRQDDGAGWYVLQQTAKHFGRNFVSYNDDFYSTLGNYPDFFFILQLIPELVDLIKDYDEVCFVDASVGSVSQELAIIPLTPGYQFSPLSHHMSPQSLLDINLSINLSSPKSYLLTVPGKEFGFSDQLSEQALIAVNSAIEWLKKWAENPDAHSG
jgi:hydrogenase maturation protease